VTNQSNRHPHQQADVTGSVNVKRCSRPSIVRYRALVEALADADRQLQQDDGHPLIACTQALRAVVQFIRADPDLGPTGLGVALRRLLGDLHDVSIGARPRMLFGGAVEQPSKAGRRTGLTFDIVRGLIVHAVHTLIQAGMANREAAQYVAAGLLAVGVRHKGKVIEPKQILQWREQTSDSAPKASDEAAKWASQLTAEFLADGSLERAKQVTALAVQTARFWDSK
jgi:hypothetical protein